MKNKKKRLQLILELIQNHSIGSQDELSQMLSTRGFNVTQATLSRDLKVLRITKIPNEGGGYMYMIPDNDKVMDLMLSQGKSVLANSKSSGFISIEFSGNMAVIKTRNGYASGIAYDIDMSKPKEILGTIPGADTVFAVLREGVTRERAVEIFSKFLPISIEPI